MKRIALIALSIGFLYGAAETKTTIGYSYVRLGQADYQAIEIGTSVVAIAKKGFVRAYTGTELSVPLFFDTRGSNIGENFEAKGSGFGVGLQVPLIAGIDIGGFYMQIMGGYNLGWLNDAMKMIPKNTQMLLLKDAKTSTISHGYIYGAGIGYNFSSNFTIGARYLRGSMNNKVQNIEDLPDGKFIPKYRVNYEKFYVMLGYRF